MKHAIEQFIKSNVCDIVNQNEKSLRQRWNKLQTVSTLLIRHSNLWNSFEFEDNERFDDEEDAEKDNDTHTHLYCLVKANWMTRKKGVVNRFTWIDTSMIWLKSTSDQCNDTKKGQNKRQWRWWWWTSPSIFMLSMCVRWPVLTHTFNNDQEKRKNEAKREWMNDFSSLFSFACSLVLSVSLPYR